MKRYGVAVVVLAALASGCYSAEDDNEGMAELACEHYVKQRLKAPATADFEHHQVVATGDRYKVEGAVDAENSFGAQLRHTYTCIVTDDGTSDESWSLETLDIK